MKHVDFSTAMFAISMWIYGMQSSLASSGYFDQGTSYYQRGEYTAASAAFSWAVLQTPNDANAHYYLANTLIKLGRLAEAQLHYMAAVRLSSDTRIKNYAQMALNELARSNGGQNVGLQIVPTSQNQRVVQSSMMGSVAPQSYVKSQVPSPPTGMPLSPPSSGLIQNAQRARANAIIDQQADLTSAGMINMGNAEAASVRRDGQYRANSARNSAMLTSQDMARAKIPNTNQPLYSQEDIEAARQRGDQASQDAMLESNQKSLEAVQYAKAKVWETLAAAKNLQDQLNEPAKTGAAKLKAEGTNLYVRNFDTPLIDPGPPLKAEPGRLQVINPLQANPKFWGNTPGTRSGGSRVGENGANSTSAVYGKVMQ